MLIDDVIVKRVVGFPLKSYDENKNNIVGFFHNDLKFQLSVLISSLSLYDDIKKNKTAKIINALEKYFNRAHFNPTPFGLFSSVGILKWGNLTEIKKSNNLWIEINYDNSFISESIDEIKLSDCLKYKYQLNPSIHRFSKNKICFYKSNILKNSSIEISYVEIEMDLDLERIINKFKQLSYIEEVIYEFINIGHKRNDAVKYLLKLIDIGLIINSFLYYPIKKNSIKSAGLKSSLIKKNNHLLQTQKQISVFINKYNNEINKFNKYDNNRNLFHAVDAFETEEGTLDIKIKEKIQRYINFTVNYGNKNLPINDRLNKFTVKLAEKYNDGFIALHEIFNPYYGINYTDSNDELDFKLDDSILNKILNCQEKQLILNLEHKKNNFVNLPATFSVKLECLKNKENNEDLIYFKGIGNTSAMNLLSRFDKITEKLCKEIAFFEKKAHYNKLIAEVNCLAHTKTINISPHKHYFDYSIPINTVDLEGITQINLSDLYLHLNNGKITLISKTYKKQVLPKLNSSINYNLSNSEIYKFLIELEAQNQELYGTNFDMNYYKNFYIPYVPKIYLEKGILLHTAQILLVDADYNFEQFNNYLIKKIENFEFSQKIIFLDLKKELLIDVSNKNQVLLLFKKLKIEKSLYISESIYETYNPVINDELGNYAHELIVSVKNTSYVDNSFDYSKTNIEEVKTYNNPLESEWIYFEVYCNKFSESDILIYINENVLKLKKVDLFFFVRYSMPENHLRLRFKTCSIKNKKHITKSILNLKKLNKIKKYLIVPYEPEIHRYGGLRMLDLSEQIFNLDSATIINQITVNELDEQNIQIIAILKIRFYLNFFNFNIESMISFCENKLDSFSNEFEFNTELRKKFNKDYLTIKNDILYHQTNMFFDDIFLKNELFINLEKFGINIANYISLIIHMSMNRHFTEMQRFNEFKTYYLTKNYLNLLKYSKKN